jgi:hydrogenase small subunit
LHEQADVNAVTPPSMFPGIFAEHGGGITTASAAVAGAVAGGAAVYAVGAYDKLKRAEQAEAAEGAQQDG